MIHGDDSHEYSRSFNFGNDIWNCENPSPSLVDILAAMPSQLKKCLGWKTSCLRPFRFLKSSKRFRLPPERLIVGFIDFFTAYIENFAISN